MLQKLNERIQGIIAWVVIVLIAITFTLFGVDYYLQNRQTTNTKVMVNGYPITNQVYETNYRRARSQQDVAHMTANDEKALQEQVLNQLINNEVTIQAAKRNGFDVDVSQANAAIINIAQFQVDGHFSSERYQQALSAALFTPETFQNEVKQGMLLNQQRFAFMGSSFALPSEMERFVRLYMQTRDYDYTTISSAAFENQVKIDDKEIRAYYEQHQNELMSPEMVGVEYVLLSMKDIRAKIKVSDDDVVHFYNENKDNYLTPAQWQVAHLLFAVPKDASQDEIAKIKQKAENAYGHLKDNPNDFTEYLKQSDDKISLLNQGVLPWITAGTNEEYSKILSPLTVIGQISSVQQTQHGFELFKLVNYKPVSMKTLDEMKETIKEQLYLDMTQTQYAQAMEQLSDLSYQTPDSLEPVAQALNLKIQKSEPFSQQGDSQQKMTQNKQVLNAAFSHDVLGLGNNSEPIPLDNDSVVVLRVKEHLAAKQLPLDVVAKQIKSQLTKQEAQAQAQKTGEILLSPIEDSNQTSLMAANNLKWDSVNKAARDSDKVNSIINDLAFNLLKPGSRDGVKLDNGDYVVVRLKKINEGTLAALDQEQEDSLSQQIESSYGMMDYDLYVSSLLSHSEIKKTN
jgi:peptidyl-prolyl cis-trans isomerase D